MSTWASVVVVEQTRVGAFIVVTDRRVSKAATVALVTRVFRAGEGLADDVCVETHLHGAHEVVCCETRILEAQRVAEELGTPEAAANLVRVEAAERANADAAWAKFWERSPTAV